MAVTKMPMSELISVSSRFQRSVHLERDFYAGEAVNGYLVTRGSLAALRLLTRGSADAAYRAQTISGPYGSGKSALAMYFARLLEKSSVDGLRETARTRLGELAEQLLPPDGQGYISILATGTRESLSQCLVNNLKRSLQKSKRNHLLDNLISKHNQVMVHGNASSRAVVRVFEDLARLAVTEEESLGVIVIVDELGKLLEHAALEPEESDLNLLQEMAELASRSYDYPMWFITILHQDFSRYASRLGRRHQREWAKIQQRFFEVPCILDDTDALQLVAAALGNSYNALVEGNKRIWKKARACNILAPRALQDNFEELCTRSYPLHPTVLVLLPALFKRFGQNERSLFSFLSADEPHSLSDWLQDQVFNRNAPPFYNLSDLHDYTYYNLFGGSPNQYSARMWTEVEDAITRVGDAPVEEISILKVIGLLSLVGETSRISASRELIRLALASSSFSTDQIDNAIKSLETKRLIVFRRFRNAYRLWEGSDIDITERLSEAYQTLPLQSVTLSVARDLCPSPPLVARRHSFHTGMIRLFSVVPSSSEGLLSNINSKGDSDGCVVHCLVENDEQAEYAVSIAKQTKETSVIIAIGKENDGLAESARDVAALAWVSKNTPSLAGDRIARQELSERRMEAETAFRSEWNRIFDPRSKDFNCYWRGKECKSITSRGFTSLLSDACDATFQYAPIVKNELINRRSLSSAAAAARRNLIEAMILNPEMPGLGITGYPPQKSIYESLLVQSAIHRKSENGRWMFGRPGNSDPGLQRAWDYVMESVGSEELKPKSVAELFKELSSAPYGVATGFVPVLLCACLIVNSSTMAMYEEDAFVPQLSIPVMERLMRRPEQFSVVSFGLDSERSSVVDRFARGFEVENRILPVVRALYARINALPQYTLATRNLSAQAAAVRDTILRAKSPERLLFVELPVAVGCEPLRTSVANSMNKNNVENFFDTLNMAFREFINCYPELLKRIERGILDIFDISQDESDWQAKVVGRASILYNSVIDSSIRTVIVRAQDMQLGEVQYIESVGAGIIGQPPSKWSKTDEDNFTYLVPRLASKLRAAESMQDLNAVLENGEDGYLLTISNKIGESMREVIRFSVADKDKIERLINTLNEFTSSTNRRILLAAVTEIARQLINQGEAGLQQDENDVGGLKE